MCWQDYVHQCSPTLSWVTSQTVQFCYSPALTHLIQVITKPLSSWIRCARLEQKCGLFCGPPGGGWGNSDLNRSRPVMAVWSNMCMYKLLRLCHYDLAIILVDTWWSLTLKNISNVLLNYCVIHWINFCLSFRKEGRSLRKRVKNITLS